MTRSLPFPRPARGPRRTHAGRIVLTTVFTAVLALSACGGGNDDRPTDADQAARADFERADARAVALVAQLSLAEKSALLYGYGTRTVGDQVWQVYVKGNSRLGIPDMVQGDAPAGIWQGSNAVTQMPNSTALAATFSREVAKLYGDTLGAETRALGYGVLHGPNVDVLRDPRHGRAHESFGEDPYLVGQTATAYVTGVQSHQVIADAKHFVVNTVEKNRTTVDAQIDARTLQELYLAPFQDVVQDGRVGMTMCAYNKINGVYACNSEDLLSGLLRGRWGFTGIMRTDAGAAHSLDSLRLGVDQEFRSESQYGTVLMQAVGAGTFSVSVVDESVRRILRTMILYGIYDSPPQRTGADLTSGAAAAQRVAEESIVLLRNPNGVLPFGTGIGSVAVIGPSVDNILVAGGPSNPAPQGKDTIAQAVAARLPGAVVRVQRGVDPIYPIAFVAGYPQLPSGALTASDGSTRGATAVYSNASGVVLATRVDTCLCHTPSTSFSSTVTSAQDAPSGTARVVWTATLNATVSGSHGFDLATNGRATLVVDGATVLSASGSTDLTPVVASLPLTAGAHTVRVEYTAASSAPQLKVGWAAPSDAQDANIRAAAAAAAQSDVAIVAVRDLESEGSDRPALTLPNDQDRLIRAVIAANPRTVVVLTTGGAVTMPWNDQAPAIVQAWYGGTRGGAALARILFGDVAPTGRLPVTFPKADTDLPTYAAERFPGIGAVAKFTEGLSTGYRYFNGTGAPQPLYPFGYGLSYTTFALTDLSLDRTSFTPGVVGTDGTYKGQPAITASFDVVNTGTRAAAVVPQVYLGFPSAAAVPAPLLKGYDKVMLQPGESRRLSIALDQRAFSTYDATAKQWIVRPGVYRVSVGQSSTDIALAGSVQVTGR